MSGVRVPPPLPLFLNENIGLSGFQIGRVRPEPGSAVGDTVLAGRLARACCGSFLQIQPCQRAFLAPVGDDPAERQWAAAIGAVAGVEPADVAFVVDIARRTFAQGDKTSHSACKGGAPPGLAEFGGLSAKSQKPQRCALQPRLLQRSGGAALLRCLPANHC